MSSEEKSEHKSVKAGGEVSKEATALIRGIQHQIKYYLGQVHVSTNDYNVYRHKELKELKGVGEVFNTYKYTKFVSEKCRDICDDIDKKMAVPKGVEPYVAKEYSPMAFAIIRRFFGVSDREMMRSICGDGNLTPPNIGAGKSGSLFMFTKDSKYILKVIPKREEKILVKVLPKYFAFIQENPQTLIPRFYGMYRIKPKHGDEYRYVVMNNLFPNTQFPLQFKFDLKGSLYGRKADENERGKKSPCYKDIDFLDQKAVIKIGPNLVNAFKTQVEKDSELMSDMHLIDYSLLVGVHQLSDTEMETAKNALDKQKQR
ncbi:phosphatidylinositol-4-phosphate 5-kinase, putative, partial [Entamoeba invadens IP1]